MWRGISRRLASQSAVHVQQTQRHMSVRLVQRSGVLAGPGLDAVQSCHSSHQVMWWRGMAKKKKSKKKNSDSASDAAQPIDTSAVEMEETVDLDLDKVKERSDRLLSAFGNELGKLRSGRPDPRILDSVRVDAYGSPTPLVDVAMTAMKGSKELVVTVFDSSLTNNVRDAITSSGLNLNPGDVVDGSKFSVPIPKTTKESREANVKRAKELREKTKQSLNSVRRDVLKVITRQKQAKEISEDEAFDLSNEIEAVIKKAQDDANGLLEEREKELLAT